MKAKNLMLFVVAVGCGLVASIGVSQYMERANSGDGKTETTKIFVAITDVGVGQKLDAQNVKLEEWPKDRVPDGAITKLEQLEDRFTRTRLYSGEPIMAAKLLDSGIRGSESITIPKGFRVVSVPVTVDKAVSGLLQPGDRVDLLVFLRKSAEIPMTGTRTLLRNINVFGVDGTTERSIDDEGKARNIKTVSLLVTPKQAETVMLGKELGTLFISLRRPDEDTEYISDGETVQSLLGQTSETAKEDENNKGNDFSNWLANQNTTTPSQPAAVVAEPVWKMIVLSDTGSREFAWTDESKLPTEATAGQVVADPAAGARATLSDESDDALHDDGLESEPDEN